MSYSGVPRARLLVVDEPFSGTNPALRVPIVVEVLDHLARHDLAIAATHDLDVAAQVSPRFVRAYFREPDDETGQFDRKLRAIHRRSSPPSNAASPARANSPKPILSSSSAAPTPRTCAGSPSPRPTCGTRRVLRKTSGHW